MNGTKTILKVCAGRWSRMMCPTWAAAYLGMTLTTFLSKPELSALVFTVDGQRVVDKEDLDSWINRKKNGAKCAPGCQTQEQQ